MVHILLLNTKGTNNHITIIVHLSHPKQPFPRHSHKYYSLIQFWCYMQFCVKMVRNILKLHQLISLCTVFGSSTVDWILIATPAVKIKMWSVLKIQVFMRHQKKWSFIVFSSFIFSKQIHSWNFWKIIILFARIVTFY